MYDLILGFDYIQVMVINVPYLKDGCWVTELATVKYEIIEKCVSTQFNFGMVLDLVREVGI